MHWDGRRWTPVPAPNVSGPVASVSADAPDDVWAVSPDRSNLVFHWDGRSWDRVVTPNPDVTNEGGHQVGGTSFRDVAASSADDVWAVGGGQSSVIEHWDGHRWTVVASPRLNLVNSMLDVVSADEADDAWAAGSGQLPTDGRESKARWCR